MSLLEADPEAARRYRQAVSWDIGLGWPAVDRWLSQRAIDIDDAGLGKAI